MVKVDTEKCIGCRSCIAICESVFEMRDDMKAHVKAGQEKSKALCVKEAIESCAVDAISG